MNDKEIEQQIQAKGLTAPRVTPNDIEANIASEHYFTAGEGVIGAFVAGEFGAHGGDTVAVRRGMASPEALKPSLNLLTFCVLVLRNGFTVTGESACASPENFDAEIGRRIARENAEREIQANSHHSGCKGERCMASAANGSAHSRECIDEAGEAQGWTPTAEDYAKCGPSAGCCGAAPTDSHASAVLYPAIERAMSELGTLHPAFNFAVNRAFNHLHDAFWSECPAPASAAPKRPNFPGV